MGRGGGGGGGRSFGGGGGRSSGGRIGGGASRGGGSFGGSFGGRSGGGGFSFGGGSRPVGGSSRPIGSGPVFGFGGPAHRPSPGGGYRPQRRRSSGCLTTVVLLFIVIVALVIIFSFLNMGAGTVVRESGDDSITKSTYQREPLPAGSVNETGYFTDELGWIGSRTTLTNGMESFYRETGVQPYLYITDTVNGTRSPGEADFEAFASELYDELFTDEAHILVIFHEYYSSDYSTWYLCGVQAKTVIDQEAADILLDYLDRYYYYDDLSDEEYFARAFSDAGERIMTVTKSPWIPVLIVLGVLLIVAVAFVWWRKAKKQKNIEAQQTEEILNTPLETFGSTEAEELSKKYEEEER